MEEIEIKNRLHRMKFLFTGFLVLMPIGVTLILSSPYQALGLIIFFIGGISGVICAFTTCPCCGQLSGVFFKVFIGGAFPIGSCIHCKQTYMSANKCNRES
ncbi:MAG: hypothetical protein JAY99_01725 [Candidatus Thiodiazotropha lotti]|nr:hypothetical protein [Candidatus Thiodiazotropha lotti]MCG7998221.1 hypothetical protein [Candidatus Thiodiazotropha lotti]MCW4182850.1 hypothetical protein [Candidatus Thiodiazotropha weberae]MCW4189987.1 hypothetical protein [Candidatus Thiodiazotropha weberae]